MFDKTGGKENKQDAVNGAALTAMKLLVQSKLGGSPAIGGSNSGGLGSLLSLVSLHVGLCQCRHSTATNQASRLK